MNEIYVKLVEEWDEKETKKGHKAGTVYKINSLIDEIPFSKRNVWNEILNLDGSIRCCGNWIKSATKEEYEAQEEIISSNEEYEIF